MLFALLDNPVVTATCPGLVNEGSSTSLACSADSKPFSSFTWILPNGTRHSSPGPVTSNQFSYGITTIDRTHYGKYSCTASNGVVSDGEDLCNLEIKCTQLLLI